MSSYNFFENLHVARLYQQAHMRRADLCLCCSHTTKAGFLKNVAHNDYSHVYLRYFLMVQQKKMGYKCATASMYKYLFVVQQGKNWLKLWYCCMFSYFLVVQQEKMGYNCGTASMYSYFLGGSTGKDWVTIVLLLACSAISWWFNRKKMGDNCGTVNIIPQLLKIYFQSIMLLACLCFCASLMLISHKMLQLQP